MKISDYYFCSSSFLLSLAARSGISAQESTAPTTQQNAEQTISRSKLPEMCEEILKRAKAAGDCARK